MPEPLAGVELENRTVTQQAQIPPRNWTIRTAARKGDYLSKSSGSVPEIAGSKPAENGCPCVRGTRAENTLAVIKGYYDCCWPDRWDD